MDIRKYLCDWELDEDFIERINRFAVWRGNISDFGNAFFVMKNLDVYAAGHIIERCRVGSSLVSLNNANKPVLLSLLCGKKIKKLVFGDSRVLVCTEEGEVFGYGSCRSRDEAFFVDTLPQKVSSLEGFRVVDIAIGPLANCLALRDDGKIEIFEFAVPSKYLVNTLPAVDTKPLNISNVTGHLYVSLLENGKIMKMDTSIDDYLPNSSAKKLKKNTCEVMKFLTTDPGKIKKIVPGFSRTLILDEYGLLYVIRYDALGELKLQESLFNSSFSEKIVDMAASRYCSLTAVLTEKGKVYMWGKGRGASILDPKLTPFKTLHEVFLHYSMPLSTYKLMNVDELLPEPSIVDQTTETDNKNFLIDMFKNALNDQKLCDLFVEVGGKTIPVHKSVLTLRCKHFVKVFQKDWPEEKPTVVEIEDGDFNVYKAFLEYLYTDQIDNSLSFNDTIELLNLANKYHIEQLAERCVLLIQSNITAQSVILLYVRATMISKDTTMKKIFDQLRDSCVKFIADYETEVVISAEFAKMDSDMAKELIIDVCKSRFKK